MIPSICMITLCLSQNRVLPISMAVPLEFRIKMHTRPFCHTPRGVIPNANKTDQLR